MQKIRSSSTLGGNIRALRKAAGLTQEQTVARLQLRGCDVSRSIYAQMECGRYNIRVEELAALRGIFSVSYDEFFAGCEKEL